MRVRPSILHLFVPIYRITIGMAIEHDTMSKMKYSSFSHHGVLFDVRHHRNLELH